MGFYYCANVWHNQRFYCVRKWGLRVSRRDNCKHEFCFFDVISVKDLKEHTEMPCVTERRISHVPENLLFYKTFCPDRSNVIDWNLFQNGIRNVLWPMLLRRQRLKTARSKCAKFLLILALSPEILDDVITLLCLYTIYFLCVFSIYSNSRNL